MWYVPNMGREVLSISAITSCVRSAVSHIWGMRSFSRVPHMGHAGYSMVGGRKSEAFIVIVTINAGDID